MVPALGVKVVLNESGEAQALFGAAFTLKIQGG